MTPSIKCLAVFLSYDIAPGFRFLYLFEGTIKKDFSNIFRVIKAIIKTHLILED